MEAQNQIGITIENLENFSPFSVDRKRFEKRLNFLKENEVSLDQNLLKIIACHIVLNEIIGQIFSKNPDNNKIKTDFESLKKLFELLEKTYDPKISTRNDQIRNLKFRIQSLEKRFSQN